MPELPRITDYKFGRIEIDGQTYTSDVVVLPDRVIRGWWREEGHELRPSDLTAVVGAGPKVLVVGQGARGLMRVPDKTLAHLREAGIEVVCAPTAEAAAIYNERRGQDEAVAGAFHLTC